MYRRIVSLLLLPCVLLTQSAAFGHSHGGSQPAGHDLRPHVHTNPVPAGHHHDHDDGHHHHGHGGHHHDVVNDVASDAPVTPPTQSPEPLSDHDSDAIYVNATDAVAVERSELPGGACDFWTVFTSDLLAQAWAVPQARPVICGHPPPLPGHVCPLYVKHRALLI